MRLLDKVTTTTTLADNAGWHRVQGAMPQLPQRTFQGVVSGTGAVTATIVIEVSNDAATPLATPAGTITLSGTTKACDGFATDEAWTHVRARCTAISGTGAQVSCILGV